MAAGVLAMPTVAEATTLTKVDNGDGTFHYALPSGASTADIVGTVFTWRYQGQANFPWAPASAPTLSLTDDDPDTGDDPSAGMNDLDNTYMVDDLGRRWKAVNVNMVEAHYAVADYGADVDATWGLDPDPTGAAPSQPLDALDSTSQGVHPRSWGFRDCDGDGVTDDMALWNAESRTTFNSGTSGTSEQDGLVSVNGTCSGYLVGSNVVMTAAHCVTDPSGRFRDPTNMTVCSSTATGSNCSNVSRVIPYPAWPGMAGVSRVEHFRFDVAILRIPNFPDTLTDPVMVFSSDDRSDIKKRTPSRVGFDAFLDNGSGGCSNVNAPTALQHGATAVRGTRTGLLRMRADDAVGGSGGPWSFTAGGVRRVVAHHALARDGAAGTGFVGGPRVTEFRNWAIGIYGNR